MSKIEDTSSRDPLLHLAGSLVEGSDAYITGMEAAGQRQVVNSTAIPTEAPWDDLLALGFVRGEQVDDLFTDVTLPPGWTRAGTNHSMWSNILDERGIERVAVFYKAAFYDRKAHCYLMRPGYSLASDAIYGDGPASLPAQYALLTDEEKADFREKASDYLDRVKEHPGIYGDRAPRAQLLLEATR